MSATDDSLPASERSKEKDDSRKEELMRSLSESERQRLSVLQELLATAGQPGYGQRQAAATQQLGITVRSVRRLTRQLRYASREWRVSSGDRARIGEKRGAGNSDSSLS